MNKDFEEFQAHFKKYQQLFGLMEYDVSFSFEPLEGYAANIRIFQEDKTARVCLNSVLPEYYSKVNVKRSAKHEAIHLLLGETRQRSFATCNGDPLAEDELYDAEEILVHKLVDLVREEE